MRTQFVVDNPFSQFIPFISTAAIDTDSPFDVLGGHCNQSMIMYQLYITYLVFCLFKICHQFCEYATMSDIAPKSNNLLTCLSLVPLDIVLGWDCRFSRKSLADETPQLDYTWDWTCRSDEKSLDGRACRAYRWIDHMHWALMTQILQKGSTRDHLGK